MHVPGASLSASQLAENNAVVRSQNASVGTGGALHNRSRQQRCTRLLHKCSPIHGPPRIRLRQRVPDARFSSDSISGGRKEKHPSSATALAFSPPAALCQGQLTL